MTNQPRPYPGHECPPSVTPAAQPYPPGDGKACEEFPKSSVPCEYVPEKCPDPDPCCNCPSKPVSTPTCFEALIQKQSDDILAAANATTFKKDLEALLKAAKDADSKYTTDKYKELVAEWQSQDAAIVELLRKLVMRSAVLALHPRLLRLPAAQRAA